MKKYIKYLIGTLFFIGLCVNGINIQDNKAYATNTNKMLRDPDIYPPTGTITVEGAVNEEGIYYISTKNVTLNITAEDDRSASGDLLMIISGDKVSKADIENEDNWEPYTEKKNWELSTNNNGLNRIYLYLKDEAGNMFNSLLISSPSAEKITYTVTYEGEGENIPEAKEATPGMIFSISTEVPILENRYFLGWSEVKDSDSVQWGRDGSMEPRYIQGDKTLYAVYSDTPPKLADVVNIGDYVDYPVEYTNQSGASSNPEAMGTGWRVIGIEDNKVKLVSAGTPLTWRCTVSTSRLESRVKEELINDFLNTNFNGNGFTGTLTSNFLNKYTDGVRSLKKEDLDILTKMNLSAGEAVEKYGTLVNNGSAYYLATFNDISKYRLWCVHSNDLISDTHGGNSVYLGWGTVGYGYITVRDGDFLIKGDEGYFESYGISNEVSTKTSMGGPNQICGIRPVVTLCTDITTTGRTDDGEWILVKDIEGSSISELKAAGLEVGDYVNYVADGATSLKWRVLSIEGETINLTIQGNGASYPLDQYDYKDAVLQLNNECARLYSNTGKQITARSMNIEDLNKAVGYIPAAITTGYKFYPIGTQAAQMQDTKIGDVTYTAIAHSKMYADKPTDFGDEPKFYILDSTEIKENKYADNTVVFGSGEILEDDRGKYLIPTMENPVYVKITKYSYVLNNLNSTINGMFTSNSCWLASPCITKNEDESFVGFSIYTVSTSKLNSYRTTSSNGNIYSWSPYLKPIVSINSRLLEKAADGNTYEWDLRATN